MHSNTYYRQYSAAFMSKMVLLILHLTCSFALSLVISVHTIEIGIVTSDQER